MSHPLTSGSAPTTQFQLQVADVRNGLDDFTFNNNLDCTNGPKTISVCRDIGFSDIVGDVLIAHYLIAHYRSL